MRSKGVRFVDLTGLYTDVTDSVYADDCCHLTQLGNDLLAAAIAEAVVKVEVERASKHSVPLPE